MKNPISAQVIMPVWMIGAIISFWMLAAGWWYTEQQNQRRAIELRVASLEIGASAAASRAAVLETANVDIIRRLGSIESKVDRIIEKR